MLVFRHPKYYEEMRKKRKKFQKEQADKQASKQASEQANRGEGGPKGHKHDRHPQPPSKCNR